MSWFREQIDLGLAFIQEAASEEIRYYRGDAFIETTAVPGDGQRKGVTNVVTLIGAEQDWMITASNLVQLLGSKSPPMRNDVIQFVLENPDLSTTTLRYQVMPKDGDDVYQLVSFSQYRIHTRLISRDC